MSEMKNPYTYPDSDVYMNKLNIRDDNQLRRFEYMATSLNGAQLAKSPIEGDYSLAHMGAIHKHLLKEVYEWAGKPRTLDFAKDDPLDSRWTTPFAPAKNIASLSEEISTNLSSKNNLRGLDKESFVKELTDVYTKMNYLHAFPEGNGRTTQLLISQIAKNAGYEIDFKSMDKNVWNLAAARGQAQVNVETGEVRPGSKEFMEKVFDRYVRPIEQTKEISAVGNTSLDKAQGRSEKSLAFEFEKPQEAVKRHPDLINAFATLQAAKLFADKHFGDEKGRMSYVEKIKQEVIGRIDSGIIPNVSVAEQVNNIDKHKSRDNDLYR